MHKSDKSSTVRVLEFHKFASQKIVPCDETPTALCCRGNRVFAGFFPSRIVVYELSELGTTGYIKSAVLNTVGIPNNIKFCPIAQTILSSEKDNTCPTNPEVSTYESGEPKVYVYPFALWTPDHMDQSLKIVRVGRTTAQNYRGDILRRAAYEVIEISLDDGTTDVEQKQNKVAAPKSCALDICPLTGNLAIACGPRVSVYRLIYGGVHSDLLDYELMLYLDTLFVSVNHVEILNSHFIVASGTKVQAISVEIDETLPIKRTSYAVMMKSHTLKHTASSASLYMRSKMALPLLRSKFTSADTIGGNLLTSSKESIYEDSSPSSPFYPTDQSADSMFGHSNSGSTTSLAMGQSATAGKTGNFKKHYSLSMLDMEKAIMAHLRVPNPSILSTPSSSTASLLTPAATSTCSSFVYNEGEIVIPKQTRNGPLNHPASTGGGGAGGARATNGLLGPSFLPLGRVVEAIWSPQFETDQLKFRRKQLPNLCVKYLYYRLMKPKLVSVQFSPRYSKVPVEGTKLLNQSIFTPICHARNNTSENQQKQQQGHQREQDEMPDQTLISQLSLIIAAPHLGVCVDITNEVTCVAEFPFAGECVSMCGDESFMYAVFKDYLEVYTSKHLSIECAVKDDNTDTSKLSSVPQFLADLWTNQPIFMCGRQNFYSLTKLERSKTSGDSILLQSIFNTTQLGGVVSSISVQQQQGIHTLTSSGSVVGSRDGRGSKSVSTVYCLVKESVQECCQAMLLRAESLKWVAQSLYLSVVLEVWVLLLNNYNQQHESMFREVSSKLLDSMALSPALSEISFQRVVKRNSNTTRFQVEESVPMVPTNVLQFLIDNSDTSSSEFLDNLCKSAKVNQGMSIDVCALNLVIEGGQEWTELLRDTVNSDPNTLTDLLTLSLTYAPHLVSRLLYGGQFQFARYLTANEVASYYTKDTLLLGGYVMSSFDKVSKASTHAACSQFELFGQTLSSLKLDDFIQTVLENISLMFCSNETDPIFYFDSQSKNSKQFKISADNQRHTIFAQLLSKIHPEYYISALSKYFENEFISKENAVKFCSASYFEDVQSIFSVPENLTNLSLRFLLEKIINSQAFKGQLKTDLNCDVFITALVKIYLMEDSETVTKARKPDQKPKNVRLPTSSQFFQECFQNMLESHDFEWIKILPPFYSNARQMACCSKDNQPSERTSSKAKKPLSGVNKTSCEALPCPCLSCRKYIIAAQSLLSTDDYPIGSIALTQLKQWLGQHYRALARENPISVTRYYESTEKLIDFKLDFTKLVIESLGRSDSKFLCLLIGSNLARMEPNDVKNLYKEVTENTSDQLEVELTLLRHLAAEISLEEMVQIIPPERKLEKYIEVLKMCDKYNNSAAGDDSSTKQRRSTNFRHIRRPSGPAIRISDTELKAARLSSAEFMFS